MQAFLRAATILFLVFFAIGSAHALEKFDFEQKIFVEFGPEVKDHSLLRVDGVYHLFYLRGNPAIDIGHATSTDLIHWKLEPPVLYVEPGTWDNGALWAPQVLRVGNGYLMYYTGVNNYVSQQAGIAFSSDLYEWIKLPWPVYHPDESWALWTSTGFAHGRDPFVFEYNGMHYMLNTAKTPYNKGAIALASSADMFNWADQGPLYVHNSWHVLESLQMIPHNGTWHLLFTEEAVNGTSWAGNGGPNPLVGWNLSTASVIDFGHAPEVNELDPGVYTFSRHTTVPKPGGGVQYLIRFDELKWTQTYPFVNKPWPLSADWTMTSGTAFLYAPTFMNNPALRGQNVDVGYEGNSWISSYELYQGPLSLGAPGGYQGDGPTGSIRSRTFTLMGNSMNLLVGGTEDLDNCYVALVKASDGEVLFRETGKNTDAMDRRSWHTNPHKGTAVYIDVVDNSATGHICVDDIVESSVVVGNSANGGTRGRNPRPVSSQANGLPTELALHQNTPNPFNPTTTINFDLPQSADVSLDIFNVNGQRVRKLHSRWEDAGTHQVTWDGRGDAGNPLSSGIYFYRLTVDGRVMATKKMILLK